MSRYREIHRHDEQHCSLQLWPGEELHTGSDSLDLKLGEAYIRVSITLHGVHYEVNQMTRSDGGDESVLTWYLQGRSAREFVVTSGRNDEPTVSPEIDVSLIPANGNSVHLTAPISGLGIRTSTLRLFVLKAHLEVFRERAEAGLCNRLEAIVRLPLLHHAEEEIYLLDEAQEYPGVLESLHAEVGVPPVRTTRGELTAGDQSELVANEGEEGALATAGTPDDQLARLGQTTDRVLRQQHFTIAALGVIAALLLLL